ncbi:c-type cytochrome [Polycladidibacter hongkongensis]|uniref:c-type cytochrome n=1 Tax=Polycladidibacter hongkongensis TaxID=1647556 RepID=UPI000831E2A7|nr:cytochrome c family protein [Pseudovibrio hongkongensis]
MDSFEWNKIAAAILFALVTFMGIGILTDIIFAPHGEQKRGYQIEVADASAPADAGGEAPVEETALDLLASASVDKGKKQAKKCAACHSFDEGGKNKVGPNLWEIVNRTPAAHEGFSYSTAMKEYAAANPAWTFEQLDEFIKNPKAHIPGTAMSYGGMKKAKDRAALLAYLRSLSASPAPIN